MDRRPRARAPVAGNQPRPALPGCRAPRTLELVAPTWIVPRPYGTMLELLNRRLADTLDLYTQAKHAHWNVKGPFFFQLHELFDNVAKEVFGFIDEIAERATADRK